MEESYIKFNCSYKQTGSVISPLRLRELNRWRDKLYSRGLIGAYDNGVGFGNISIRTEDNNFIITGSATGNLKKLTADHYALVNDYDLAKNSLSCAGPLKASAESLSHAAVYECSPKTNAVIHIHNLTMWEKLIDRVPTTDKNAAYGTPEMAKEIKRLFRESKVNDKKIIAMGGHREGLISFGANLNEAGDALLNNKYF